MGAKLNEDVRRRAERNCSCHSESFPDGRVNIADSSANISHKFRFPACLLGISDRGMFGPAICDSWFERHEMFFIFILHLSLRALNPHPFSAIAKRSFPEESANVVRPLRIFVFFATLLLHVQYSSRSKRQLAFFDNARHSLGFMSQAERGRQKRSPSCFDKRKRSAKWDQLTCEVDCRGSRPTSVSVPDFPLHDCLISLSLCLSFWSFAITPRLKNWPRLSPLSNTIAFPVDAFETSRLFSSIEKVQQYKNESRNCFSFSRYASRLSRDRDPTGCSHEIQIRSVPLNPFHSGEEIYEIRGICVHY